MRCDGRLGPPEEETDHHDHQHDDEHGADQSQSYGCNHDALLSSVHRPYPLGRRTKPARNNRQGQRSPEPLIERLAGNEVVQSVSSEQRLGTGVLVKTARAEGATREPVATYGVDV